MRCFIAVGCPQDIREGLSKAAAELAGFGGMKTVERDSLHLTVKFLGEVETSRLGQVSEALSSVKFNGFDAVLAGVGVFPDLSNPKVVWAGLKEGFDEAVRLHEAVDAVLGPLGFAPEERFHPHLTLARVKGPADKAGLGRFIKEHDGAGFGSFRVGEFLLMESRLGPGGPRYSVLERFSAAP